MRKAQMFILSAVVIAMTIVDVASVYFYSSLPAQSAVSAYNSLAQVTANARDELVTTIGMDSADGARIDAFTALLAEEAGWRNINMTITNASASVEACDFNVTASPGAAQDWSITSEDFEQQNYYSITFRVCY